MAPIEDLTTLTWWETRVYTCDVAPNWYLSLLGFVVRPFRLRLNEQPFWFTRYECSLRRDPHAASITLAPHFLFPTKENPDELGTRSIRIRFSGPTDHNSFFAELAVITNGRLCYEPIVRYKSLAMAEDRVCVDRSTAAVARRANIVGQLLCWNSLLVLDALVEQNNKYQFELNEREALQKTSFRYILHMLNDAYGDETGGKLWVYLFDQEAREGARWDFI